MTHRIYHLTSLLVLGFLCTVSSAQPKQPPPEAVAKLIAQLDAEEFQTRQEASDKLEKLGTPVLPTLRKALKSNVELEAKRRLTHIIARIEAGVVQAEEKLWKDFDAKQQGVKDRLSKIVTTTPTATDRQMATAIYLVSVGRGPTETESKDAQKQLADGSTQRVVRVMRLSRPLVKGKEFNTALAGVNERLTKVRKDLAPETDFLKAMLRLNSAEFQKVINEAGEATAKATKRDEDLIDLTYLLTLSRFPAEQERKLMLAHLKKATKRASATSDLLWALLNTKEFLGIK